LPRYRKSDTKPATIVYLPRMFLWQIKLGKRFKNDNRSDDHFAAAGNF
jgi:hypothetical protein